MGTIHHIWCQIVASLSTSFLMGWEMLWALVLGFAISSLVQSLATKSQINKWLPNHNFKSIFNATLFGAASSSCSYAAAAITHSLIKQGADFTAAMAFQIASTNLVVELGILLAVLLGWQFTLAQLVGGIFMITFMSVFFHFFLPKPLIASAITQTQNDPVVNMEEHSRAMSIISRYFFMDWSSLWSDILLGIFIAGALSTWIPDTFWTILFCKNNSALAHIVNPLIGPVIAILSFVCSIGNVPMAAVLWHQGMTFGGVLSFLFADLIVFPLLNIYRKYYGLRMSAFLAVSFYICMVAAAYCCEWLFTILGLVPNSDQGNDMVMSASAEHPMMHHAGITFNDTSILNIIAIIFTAFLFKRFYQSGGLKMLSSDKHSCH